MTIKHLLLGNANVEIHAICKEEEACHRLSKKGRNRGRKGNTRR